MKDNNYDNWICSADQWILIYLSATRSLGPKQPHLFAIAHAFELYLKAYITKKYDSNYAIKKSHNLFEMYCELQSELSNLPIINKSEFENYSIESNSINDITSESWIRRGEIEYIILLFKYIDDLKYPSAYYKKAKGKMGYGYGYPEFKIAKIFYQIRTHLKWPMEKEDDLLYTALNHDVFHPDHFYDNKIKFVKICIDGVEKEKVLTANNT